MNPLNRCLFSLLASGAIAAGVSRADERAVALEGIWNATASTDSGDKHYTITITRDGETLGGKIVEDGKEEGRNLDRVTVDGKSISIGIDFESDGQKGEVKVAAEQTNAGLLEGKWSIVNSTGTELVGGEWEAEREMMVTLAGTWDSVGELPEGGAHEAVLTIAGKPGEYSGSFDADGTESNVKKIVEANDKVTIDLVLVREGVELLIQIRSNKDGNDLVGSWHLLDGNGGESATGGWKATRRVEFSLAGTWDVVAILAEGDEMNATFEISNADDGFTGKAKLDGKEAELKSITLRDDGQVTIAFGYEVDGTAGVVTINAKPDGSDTLEGQWVFAAADGSENHEGKWTASRATSANKRGVLRGR